jgi:Xaa-Pro aminopeptidase
VRQAMRAANLDAFVVTHLPNVRYLSGLSSSAGLILITDSACTLLVDFRYAGAARSILDADPQLAGEFRLAVPPASYDEGLLSLLGEAGAHRIGIESAWMSVSRFNWLSSRLAGTAPTPLESADPCPVLVPTERIVEEGRLIKDEEEIATIREAAARLSSMVPEAVALVRPGRREVEIASDIDALIRRRGFERPAFETIVASGLNSARPHARPTSRILEDGDGVVLDFGGVYDAYCVDLSRTVQLGDGGPAFRRIFDAVREAQQAAIAAVRPGIAASEVDRTAREVLRRHGLAEAFGHGTGHGLGLEVHEEPRIGRPVAGLPDVTLAPGMVFTIEPGAYVDGIGGVRIEDDVLVTDKGCDVLTEADWNSRTSSGSWSW